MLSKQIVSVSTSLCESICNVMGLSSTDNNRTSLIKTKSFVPQTGRMNIHKQIQEGGSPFSWEKFG